MIKVPDHGTIKMKMEFARIRKELLSDSPKPGKMQVDELDQYVSDDDQKGDKDLAKREKSKVK